MSADGRRSAGGEGLHPGAALRRAIWEAGGRVVMARARYVCWRSGIGAVSTMLRQVDRQHVRRILVGFGATVGAADIESGLSIHNARGGFGNLTIEDGCHVGKDVMLDLKMPIVVRAGSTLSMRTTVLTHTDLGQAAPKQRDALTKDAPVEIGPRAYLGACCVVLAGCRINADAVIGAGAVVTADVEAEATIVGVPGRRQLRDGGVSNDPA